MPCIVPPMSLNGSQRERGGAVACWTWLTLFRPNRSMRSSRADAAARPLRIPVASLVLDQLPSRPLRPSSTLVKLRLRTQQRLAYASDQAHSVVFAVAQEVDDVGFSMDALCVVDRHDTLDALPTVGVASLRGGSPYQTRC
ncbi:hypothetical protein SUDANB43_06736 [Streptomyces sp. enrichment culture]